jgi:hypothetical protein
MFFSGTTLLATAQSWNRNFTFHLTYSQLPPKGELASAFDLLAYNNNKSVLSLSLNLSYEAQFSLTRSAAGIPVLQYKVRLLSVKGSTGFRDFRVDSLLIPQKVEAEINVYHNHKLQDSLTQTIFVNRAQILLPVSSRIPLSSLFITFNIKRVVYTKENYLRLVRTAGEINHYYGYLEIIKELPHLLLKTHISKTPPARYFLNYIILSRLESYIRQHNLSQRLHLSQHDPLNFEKAFKVMSRKQIRMKTLMLQMLNNNVPARREDEENFTHGYVALSIKAVSFSKEQQPFIAASLNEFARIFPGDEEAAFIQQAETYYQQNNSSGQETVSQEIYKYFIDAASLKIRQKSFVHALGFLSNAAYLKNHFPEVKRLVEFDSCLILARDGLATSYLKVARMASDNHDRQLSEKYMKEATESLNAYSSELHLSENNPCYLNYSHEIIQMAKASLGQAHFRKTLLLLSAAGKACPQSSDIDSLRTLACKGLLKRRLNVSRQLSYQDKIEAARDTLLGIAKDYPLICVHTSKMLQDSVILQTAGFVFRKALLKSRNLSIQKQAVETMTCLNIASDLQKTFSLPPSSTLDSLISTTTIPYITDIAKTANLEIWKKHFAKADSIYQLARSLSLRNNVAENPEVKSTLSTLSFNISVAECQWKQEKLHRIFTQINQDVKAYRLPSAKSRSLKAKKLYAQFGNCTKDKQQTDSIFRSFATLFHFTDAYHQLTLKLFSKGFQAVLPGFIELEEQYQTGHLKRFGLPFTGLYSFVKSQHSEKLTMEAVHYFIQSKKFGEALRYLQLSEDAAHAKAEQKQIAIGYAGQNLLPQQEVLDAPAFSVFNKTYRKARAAK